MPYDDFKLRELKDQLWSDCRDVHTCTECRKPCGTEIEWIDGEGRGKGEYMCESCADADEGKTK
jgi:hypothetical protein